MAQPIDVGAVELQRGCEAGASVLLKHRGDAIAGKPAPTWNGCVLRKNGHKKRPPEGSLSKL